MSSTDDTTETSESCLKVLGDTVHVSVGSAATNVHCSMDLSLSDPKLDEQLTSLLETWERLRIARERYDARRKK